MKTGLTEIPGRVRVVFGRRVGSFSSTHERVLTIVCVSHAESKGRGMERNLNGCPSRRGKSQRRSQAHSAYLVKLDTTS